MKFATFTAAVAAATLLTVSQVFAQDTTPAGGTTPAQGQDQGGGRGNRRGGGGPGGNFDPAQFQQRMNERLKESLKATDEEWAVIQPLLEKVQTKQHEARVSGGFGGGMGRRGGGSGGPGGAPGAPAADQGNQANQGNRGNRGGNTSPEAEALRTALQSDSTSPEEIKTKLAALRDARKKSQAELEQARADLAKVLTVKQEATLVLMGMLE